MFVRDQVKIGVGRERAHDNVSRKPLAIAHDLDDVITQSVKTLDRRSNSRFNTSVPEKLRQAVAEHLRPVGVRGYSQAGQPLPESEAARQATRH